MISAVSEIYAKGSGNQSGTRAAYTAPALLSVSVSQSHDRITALPEADTSESLDPQTRARGSSNSSQCACAWAVSVPRGVRGPRRHADRHSCAARSLAQQQKRRRRVCGVCYRACVTLTLLPTPGRLVRRRLTGPTGVAASRAAAPAPPSFRSQTTSATITLTLANSILCRCDKSHNIGPTNSQVLRKIILHKRCFMLA
ncbi:uncharacterized protein LOC126234996 [Schistocerca nitens]|uniref:uncharacterized protein LOC126234996 n=1 Tax=Schistocerca nitens TaxID=7011 RepID=UPI00211994A4|nr:uncharacterized protein LOC126234996 [Schistocerca nitens]